MTVYTENHSKCKNYKGHKNVTNLAVFDILKNHSRKYNIIFSVKNREKLRKLKIIENIPDNINVTIKANHKYDLDTYKQEENKIENLVSKIRDSDLSPLEK